MYKHDKNRQPKKQRNKNFRHVWQVKREQCSMIHIKYGPNQQGIMEVEIQPQPVEGPIKKSKRLEQKRNNLKKKEKSTNVVPTPPKREKVWKHKEEALESTTTSPKRNKMVWRPKKEQKSVPTPPGTDTPSSSKN
jgi:hypothetical protein